MALRTLSENKQATAKGDGLKEVVLGVPAFFEIDTNEIDGLVDVKIIGTIIKLPGNITCSEKSLFKTNRTQREYYFKSNHQSKEWVISYRV